MRPHNVLGLILTLLASDIYMALAAPAPSNTKPVHIDRRDSPAIAKTKLVHIDRRRSSTKPVHVSSRGIKPIQTLRTRADSGGKSTTTTLKPVRLDQLNGVQRRDIEGDYTRLDLAHQAFMVYAAQEKDGKGVMMANMTLFSPDGVPVILMERFEGLTKAVDCSIEKDGFIGLTLRDQKGFQYAKDAWDWINEGEDDEFIMITDHEGCSPGDERKAFHVHQIDYNVKNLEIKLFATHAPWEEIAGSYDLKFATLKNKVPESSLKKPVEPQLQARFKIGGIKDWFKDKFDKAKEKLKKAKDKFGDSFDSIVKELGDIGDKTFDKELSWNLDAGTPGQRSNIYTDEFQKDDPRQILDCTDCYIRGQIQFVGHLKVENFEPKEAWFSVSPENLEVKIELNLKLKATEGEPLAKSLDFLNTPFGGISIPNIFNLGPKFEYEISLITDIKRDMDITFGATATVPNDAILKVKIPDFGGSEFSNWEKGRMDSLPFRINSGTVDSEFEFTASPVLGVEIYAIGLISYEAALKFRLPRVKSRFTTIEDPAGACEKSDTAQTMGVKSHTEVSFGLDFVVGEDKIVATRPPLFEKNLFQYDLPATEGCTPVGEPRVPGGVQESGPEPQPNDPPADAPPADAPPADTPPAEDPPADTPPAEDPPVDTPPADTPPAEDPPVDTPPADTPPADTPPAEDPPAEDPPADEPSADTSPADEPPAEDPPAEDPPVDTPPAEDPPAEDPPVDTPPAEDPPVDTPPADTQSDTPPA